MRLVLIIFTVTVLQALPTTGLPTSFEIYKALLAAGITAALLLESGVAPLLQVTGPVASDVQPLPSGKFVVCGKCGKFVPDGVYCDLCGAKLAS